MSAVKPTSSNQADLLLWIAGGAIAAVGSAWLFITQPWATGGADAPAADRDARTRFFGDGVAGTDGRGRGSCRRRRRSCAGPGPRQSVAHGAARVRRRHAHRARGVQRVDALLARVEDASPTTPPHARDWRRWRTTSCAAARRHSIRAGSTTHARPWNASAPPCPSTPAPRLSLRRFSPSSRPLPRRGP